MLHATLLKETPTPGRAPRSTAPVMGGEAWIVPFEPGGPAWITATAPSIRMVDQRTGSRAGSR